VRAYTDEDIEAIKQKWSIAELIHGEIEIDGAVVARLPLVPFTLPSFDTFADESLKDHDGAIEALLYRAVRFYSAAEIAELRRRCAALPAQVFAILAGDAGFATGAPARYQVDAFNASTPPLVLEQAGLDEATAAKVLADLAGETAKVVSVRDQDEQVIFGAVLGAPGEGERHILQKARESKSGMGAAARSAAAGCIRWSSEELAKVWTRYPAIPVMHLAETIGDMGGASATRRFRRG